MQLLLLLFLLYCSCSFALDPGLLFDGPFAFVNACVVATGKPLYNNGPAGSIFYYPSSQGALKGNVSVCFGDHVPDPTDADSILEHVAAYAGGYVIDAQQQNITHYPEISTWSTPGIPLLRRFEFFEDGNLLVLTAIADPEPEAFYWRRIHPLSFSHVGTPYFSLFSQFITCV